MVYIFLNDWLFFFLPSHCISQVPIGAVFTAILVVFGLLVLLGIGESAPVALGIFCIHLATLAIVIVDCIVAASKDGFHTLITNWNTDNASIPGANTYGFIGAIFFGTCAGLLGVSGFETSANFVEEQKPGVFPKTLRNMWAIVSVFNPLISLCGLAVLPLDKFMGFPLVDGSPNNASMLSDMASSHWLKTLVTIDAVLVLSGAVITAYVGVIGLVRRMALDRCLPSLFLTTNQLRGTNHWIIAIFMLLALSLYFIMNGNILILGGVYSMAFLSVMVMFGMSNILLKIHRARIKRTEYAPVPMVIAAMACLVAGIVGNAISNHEAIGWTVLYFTLTAMAVFFMFQRTPLFRLMERHLKGIQHERFRIFGCLPTRLECGVCTDISWSILTEFAGSV